MSATRSPRPIYSMTALLRWAGVMLLFAAGTVVAQDLGRSSSGALPGDYELVNLTGNSLQMPPPIPTIGSLKIATLDVYVSFQCPHCQAFYPNEAVLQQRYGDRLVIRRHYVALSENSLNEDLRLYLVARDAGKGDRAADLLMRAGLDEQDGHQRLEACAAVAEQLSLSDAYAAALRDPLMITRVHKLDQQSTFVTSTPTLILNDRLSFGGDLHNAEVILDAVLQPSSVRTMGRR